MELLKTNFMKQVKQTLSDLIFNILDLQKVDGLNALAVDGIPTFAK